MASIRSVRFVLASLVTLTLGASASIAGEPAPAKHVGDPYPFATCPISGKDAGSMGDAVIKVYDGQEVRFCCAMCPPKFEKGLAASLAKLDTKIMDDQRPLYPITSSIVTGVTLPASPYEFVYGNRLIRLAAESEKAAFLADPTTFMAALNTAVIAAQGPTYTLGTCPVSDEALDDPMMGKPVDVVVAGRLVRLCCNKCKKDVEANPAKYIALVDAARAKAGN